MRKSARRNAQGTDPSEQGQRQVEAPMESSEKQLATRRRRIENTFSLVLFTWTWLELADILGLVSGLLL